MSLLVQKAERFYSENFQLEKVKTCQHEFTYLINACVWVRYVVTSNEPNPKLFAQLLMADT